MSEPLHDGDPWAEGHGEDYYAGDPEFDAEAYARWHRGVAVTAARWSELARGVRGAVNEAWHPIVELRKADFLDGTEEADAKAAISGIHEHLAALQRITDSVAWRASLSAQVADGLAAEARDRQQAELKAAASREGDVAECGYCTTRITLLGGYWTDDDGTTACTDTSAPYVPHAPKEAASERA